MGWAQIDYIQAQGQSQGWYRPKPIVSGGWATLIPQSGLINAWPYDTANTTTGTATDPIGGKNSTQTSVTLNGSGPTTNLNNAAVFNGTTSRGDTTLASIPGSAFSIVMWINFSVNGGVIMGSGDPNTNNKGFLIQPNTANTTLQLGNGTAGPLYGTGSFSASTWIMLTWAYDGTNVSVYKNATLNGTSAFAGPVVAATTPTTVFGVNSVSNTGFYTGMLAGVAIYNRAITGAEVTTINGL